MFTCRVSEGNVNNLTHIRPSLDQGQEPNYSVHANANIFFFFPKWYKQVHPMNADESLGVRQNNRKHEHYNGR